MLIDYHLHNHFSPDSEADTRKMVARAIEMGMHEICFTNHVETHDKQTGKAVFDPKEARERFKAIKQELDEVQAEFPQVRIKFGAELEYVPEHMEALAQFVADTPFDFILGSVHIVQSVIIASHKFAHQLYQKVGEETAYLAYFELLQKMVAWGHFDAVSHFDINKKAGVQFYGPFQPEKYKDQIRLILYAMKEKEIGLELNTKCINNRCHEIFPHPTILKWALEIGIKHFTLSSDAHKIEDVSQHIQYAFDLAKELGIPSLSTYEKRVPEPHGI